jgi:hypothetical protein
MVEKEKIDLNNINERKGWIQAYATEHLEGIKLQNERGEQPFSPSTVSML